MAGHARIPCARAAPEIRVDLGKVREASRLMQQFLNRPLPSYILRVGTTAELYAKAALAKVS